MIKYLRKIIGNKRKNTCLTYLGQNRQYVIIKRVKNAFSLKKETKLSKYFLGARSIAPNKIDMFIDRYSNVI